MREIARHPQVTDVVLYYPMSVVLGTLPDPQPAIVTRVHPPYKETPLHVAIECFGHPEKALHRAIPFSETPKGGHWTWPPSRP